MKEFTRFSLNSMLVSGATQSHTQWHFSDVGRVQAKNDPENNWVRLQAPPVCNNSQLWDIHLYRGFPRCMYVFNKLRFFQKAKMKLRPYVTFLGLALIVNWIIVTSFFLCFLIWAGRCFSIFAFLLTMIDWYINLIYVFYVSKHISSVFLIIILIKAIL